MHNLNAKAGLAIFDLDGTLIYKNCSFSFGNWLYSQGKLSKTQVFLNILDYALHKCGLLSIETVHLNAKSRFLKRFDLDHLSSLAEAFISMRLPSLINPKILERAKKAADLDYEVHLLSSSPSFLVEPIAKMLELPHWQATVWHKNSIELMTGEKKKEILERRSTELQIPLSKTIAFSDSHLDLPLLKSAGKAVAVCPDRMLKKISVINNWEIL